MTNEIPAALKSDTIDPAEQSRLILAEVGRRAQAQVDSLVVKGGGNVQVRGGGGQWVVSRDATDERTVDELQPILRKNWYTVHKSPLGNQVVTLNWLGPVVGNNGYVFPSGVPGTYNIGFGLKIYAWITTFVSESTFTDPDTSVTKNYQTYNEVLGYQIITGTYGLLPTSSVGVGQLSQLPTGFADVYLPLLRLDFDGVPDPFTSDERDDEITNRNNYDGFVDFPTYGIIDMLYGPRG